MVETVSVVIPSRNRPGLVGRAVGSALGQTLPSVEVVVVIDGPDDATRQALALVGDPRLRVKGLPESVGAQEARNAGVRESTGRWVAFLDDDDEWLPEKLERQVEAARASGFEHPVVSCEVISRLEHGDLPGKGRSPRPGESIDEYLFLRDPFELSEIRLQTSTILTTRELAMRVPWRRCAHDEWDLLLRAAATEGVGLAFVPEPLAVWHADAGRDRLSYQAFGTWRTSLAWFHSVRHLVGAKAYASFLLSTLSVWARNSRDRKAFFDLPLEAMRHGRPSPTALVAHVGRFVLPKRLRRSLKAQAATLSPRR